MSPASDLIEGSGIAVDSGSGSVLGRSELRFDLVARRLHVGHLALLFKPIYSF